jgi:hypothetical protein
LDKLPQQEEVIPSYRHLSLIFFIGILAVVCFFFNVCSRRLVRQPAVETQQETLLDNQVRCLKDQKAELQWAASDMQHAFEWVLWNNLLGDEKCKECNKNLGTFD